MTAKELMKSLNPQQAFKLAEQLCAAAYHAQGGPSESPEEREEQHLEREARNAGWFEHLYVQVRNMADDWHRESTRRYLRIEAGRYDHDYLDADNAIKCTGKLVVDRIKDWDY